jgi:hypothetical protein
MPPLVAAASSAHSAFHARTIAAEQTPCHYQSTLGGRNMTLANVIEIAIAVAVIVVAIRFFVKRG